MFLQATLPPPPPTAPPVTPVVQVPKPNPPPVQVNPSPRRTTAAPRPMRRVPRGVRVWYWPPMDGADGQAGSPEDPRATATTAKTLQGTPSGKVPSMPATLPSIEPIYFPSGSSEIHHGHRNLMAMAAFLKGNPQVPVTCIGFTDPRGSNKSTHQKLSLARAAAVRGELTRLGVQEERIRVEAHGSDPGTGKGAQEDKFWTARRVEVRLGPGAPTTPPVKVPAPVKQETETEKVTVKEGA